MKKSDKNAPKILLASSSPRRRKLLEALGVAFTVETKPVDESVCPGEKPHDYVQRLAREKAHKVQCTQPVGHHPGPIIIGADTSVVIQDRILGKPEDAADARNMLRRLSGKTHHVITGLAVLQDAKTRISTVTTQVVFKPITEDVIRAYVNTGEPFDKAGAYAIQGKAQAFVESIQGSWSNVVGLPLEELSMVLNEWGIDCLSPPQKIFSEEC